MNADSRRLNKGRDQGPRDSVLTIALMILCTLCVNVRAANVVFTFQSPDSTVQAARGFCLYPIGGPFTNAAGAIITRDRVCVTTGTNGSVTISNVYGWTYRSELQGTYAVTTNFYTFPVTNGTISADLYTGSPTNGPALAYSAAQSDSNYVAKAGATMTGGLVNNSTGALGGFIGNGGNVTNLQGSNVVGVLPAPSTFTNLAASDGALGADTNAAYFFNTLAANPIVRTTDRQSIAGFVAELKRGGLFSNLVDAAFLKTNLGATASQVVSLLGRTNTTATNITYTSWGASFNGTTSEMSWAFPDTRTNTIALLFRRPGRLGNTASAASCGLGLFGGAGGSAAEQKIHVDLWVAPLVKDGASENPGSYSFTAVVDQMTGEYWVADNQRRLATISFNGTNAWSAFNGHTNVSTNFAFAVTTPLTNLVIGMQPGSPWSSPYNGEIAAWAVFNTSNPTTAQLLAIEKAFRWLEDSEENVVFLGDSLSKPLAVDENNFANSDGSNTYTNGWPCIFMLTASQNGNVCWWNESASGRTSSDYGASGGIRAQVRTNDFVMHGIGGKVKKLKVFYLIGANDWIGGETNGTNSFNNLTNLTEEAKSYGAEVYVLTSSAAGTNASSPPTLWWTAAGETARQQFNTLLRINAGLFNGLFDRDLLFNVSDMATNLLNTADGLHLTKQGSRTQAKAIAGQLIGRPIATAVYDESGNVVRYSARVKGSVENVMLSAINQTNSGTTASGQFVSTNFTFSTGQYLRTNTDGSIFMWPLYEERDVNSLMLVQATLANDSGGPLDYPDCAYFSAASTLWFHFQAPWWATNMTISYMVTSSQATSFWTNQFQEWYFNTLSSRTFGTAQTFGPINGANASIQMYTNSVTLDATKNPKSVDWRFLVGTNTTGNRFLLSPVRFIWR
jgi:lysophospholipase L1-like esterase